MLHTRLPLACLAGALLLVAGCSRTDRNAVRPADQATDPGPRPTPAPDFDIDKASLDDVLRYARSLEYLSHPGASDEQALAVANRDGALCPEECRYGPVARIQPETGSVAIADGDFRKGRIISRMISQGPGDYDKLNLGARDTTYIWVRETDKGWQARFVSSRPERSKESFTDRPFKPDDAHPGRYTRSAARWVWQARDETTWGTCGNKCCPL